MATRRVLVLFVDALGLEAAEQLAPLCGLRGRGELRGEAGFSSAALATVLTGASPREHGRLCLFSQRAQGADAWLSPLRWLGLLPRVVHERERVRRLVARHFTRREGLTGYFALHRVPPQAFSWLDAPEREDLFAARDVDGARTFLADARDAGLSVYASPWQLTEEARWAHAFEALARKPELTFLYSAELDALAHRHGPDSAALRPALRTLAQRVHRARELLSEGGDPVTTLVLGDHGMAGVRRVVDPRAATEQSRARTFVDSTMLRAWGDARSLGRLRAACEAARWPGRWLDRAALEALEVRTEGSPWGDAFFQLEEGALFAPSYVGGRVAGMHGYGPDAPSARAALLHEGLEGAVPGSLRAVAPAVRRALGLAGAEAAS